MTMPRTLVIATLTLGLLTGCGGPAPNQDESTPPAAKLPEGLLLTAVPEGAVSLSEARANAAVGETVAFTGYIGGRVEPFTEGRALFLMADTENAPACTDECATPWDACCTASDTIAANSATVQLTDAEGKLLHLSLQGRHGLAPGAALTVVGEVRQANEAVFVVDATGIAVQQSPAG